MNALPERIEARIDRQADGCWIWTGHIDRDGYGRGPRSLAHRLVYEASGHSIPAGLELDHLCRVRACVNPDHLEPVTRVENNRRRWAGRDECEAGHPLSGDNVRAYIDKKGSNRRACRACDRRRSLAYKQRKSA